MPPARNTPRGRPSRERARYGLYVALGLAVIVLPVVVLSSIDSSEGDLVELDASLCPTDATAIAGRTVLLLDVGKPVSDATAGLAAELLHQVTLDMAANAELQVFLVAANPLAPRVLVERLCKPYASDDLAVATAKDRSGETRDCDDLPAQLSHHVRNRAAQFCERRDALKWRLDGILGADWPATVENAYLVEAIEDTRLALARFANPSLYVLSDMLQHAEWYSHAERGPNDWSYEDFAHARERQTGLVSEPPPADPDLAVTVYYVPRRGLTEHPRVARAHQQFWRRYFVDVRSLTFDEQPVHIAYAVQPFVDRTHTAGPRAVAEAAPGEQSGKSELGEPPQHVPAAEPAVPLEDGDADAPPVASSDADAEIADDEAEAAPDTRAADNAPAPEAMPTVPTTEPAPSIEDAPPSVAVADPGDPPQPSAGNTTPAEAAPADLAQPDENAATLSDVPGNPEQPTLEDQATDGTEPAALSPGAVSPEPVSADPPEAAANRETTTDVVENFCPATLRAEFAGVDVYPLGGNTRGRRVNYGSADIIVGFTINEDGETVDSDVAVQSAGSTVDLPRYTDLFTRRAEQVVRGWSYDFASVDGCERRQQRVVRLEFRYRR
ncbi:MAG: hypothetical protein OXI79_03970 [Gammaproteobacteria bacterium]|nr:hypothetical protein [Gammaproteobacteria bacterium]